MSKLIKKGNKKIIIIESTKDAKCEECGKIAELRPYGLNGKKICFECGMKNPELTKQMMNSVLFGEDNN